MKRKTKFITLPTGDCIRADAIVAVRPLDAHKEMQIRPRVVVNFVVGGLPNNCTCYTGTNAERDALAKSIRTKLNAR